MSSFDRVTIVLLVSRSEYLHQVFAYLELMDCDASRVNLLTIVDGDADLYVDARNRTDKSKFNEKLCINFPDDGKVAKYNIKARRVRIAALHNFAKQFISDCDYVFGVEDDTLVPKKALEKLLRGYVLYPHAGFITGVEVGRWGVPYVGAWKVDNVYKPSNVTTALINDDSDFIEEIDAAGFYCFLTRRDDYVNHTFDVFDDNVLGPDVNYGISLRKQGYMNYIDWTINCIHRSGDESITPKGKQLQRVSYTKDDSGRWKAKILK